MGKYFGTDGFRGEANVVLTVEHAFKVGRYLGWYFGQEHKARVVIGKDTRRSSYMFEYALAAGITASGADAYLLHVTTTPSVSYVVRTENFIPLFRHATIILPLQKSYKYFFFVTNESLYAGSLFIYTRT